MLTGLIPILILYICITSSTVKTFKSGYVPLWHTVSLIACFESGLLSFNKMPSTPV